MQTMLEVAATIFALIAGWFIYVGLAADVSIGGVANLQLMHVHSANIAIGIGAAVVSAILWVGAAIIGAIRRASQPE